MSGSNLLLGDRDLCAVCVAILMYDGVRTDHAPVQRDLNAALRAVLGGTLPRSFAGVPLPFFARITWQGTRVCQTHVPAMALDL